MLECWRSYNYMNFIADITIWIAYLVSLYFTIFLLLVYLDKKSSFKTEKSSIDLRQFPVVSVLIPAYNEESTIIKTLQSVYNLEYPKEKLDVIIIDDGSSDKTKEIATAYIQDKPHFRILSHKNQGKAASMNRALKIATGEFFACLDADSFVDPLTLRKMLAFYYHQNDPALVIVTPAMKVHSPKNILQKIQWLEYIVMIFIGRLSSQLDSLYVAPGPFSLYKTDLIRKIGGFDEQCLTEDQEIAYRVQRHQLKIKQCFDGYVYTVAPGTIGQFYRQRRRWYMGSITCLYKYKNMVANSKYGDFGMMQMIKNVAGFFVAVTGIGIGIYVLFWPLLIKMKNLFLIRFDIIPYISNFRLDLTMLDILMGDFRKFFVLFFLAGVGIFFFYRAHQNANEKMLKFGWIPLIPYSVFYYLLKGIILLLCFAQFSRSKRIRW